MPEPVSLTDVFLSIPDLRLHHRQRRGHREDRSTGQEDPGRGCPEVIVALL